MASEYVCELRRKLSGSKEHAQEFARGARPDPFEERSPPTIPLLLKRRMRPGKANHVPARQPWPRPRRTGGRASHVNVWSLFPIENFPAWLQRLAEFNPMTRVLNGAREALLGHPDWSLVWSVVRPASPARGRCALARRARLSAGAEPGASARHPWPLQIEGDHRSHSVAVAESTRSVACTRATVPVAHPAPGLVSWLRPMP
jgi:hypothetical protein